MTRKRIESEDNVKPSKRLYIVAGNYEQFHRWMQQNIIYVSDPQQLRGHDLRNSELILAGTYWENIYLDEILADYKSGSLEWIEPINPKRRKK